jgi:hypothetical protein
MVSVEISVSSVALSGAVRAPRNGDPRAPDAGRPADAHDELVEDRVTISREARAAGAGTALTPEQQRHLQELRSRDARVRAHEAAHQAGGGALAGGASFTYELGPDAQSYAVAGEVPIRLQQGGTPDETIANARQVRRAALAPVDPSAQDLAVAAQATSMEQAALAMKARQAAHAYAGRPDAVPPRRPAGSPHGYAAAGAPAASASGGP